MKILLCVACRGELDVIDNHGIVKIVKCKSCGLTNAESAKLKEPEVLVIRKRNRE